MLTSKILRGVESSVLIARDDGALSSSSSYHNERFSTKGKRSGSSHAVVNYESLHTKARRVADVRCVVHQDAARVLPGVCWATTLVSPQQATIWVLEFMGMSTLVWGAMATRAMTVTVVYHGGWMSRDTRGYLMLDLPLSEPLVSGFVWCRAVVAVGEALQKSQRTKKKSSGIDNHNTCGKTRIPVAQQRKRRAWNAELPPTA